MADDGLDSLLGTVSKMIAMRNEKVIYRNKTWTKETFDRIPLLWVQPITRQSYLHALLICVQMALSLSTGAVAGALSSRLGDLDILSYIIEVCIVLIKAGYSIPTYKLHRRIPGLEAYLSSVLAPGEWQQN
jgi:hypothetical protein